MQASQDTIKPARHWGQEPWHNQLGAAGCTHFQCSIFNTKIETMLDYLQCFHLHLGIFSERLLLHTTLPLQMLLGCWNVDTQMLLTGPFATKKLIARHNAASLSNFPRFVPKKNPIAAPGMNPKNTPHAPTKPPFSPKKRLACPRMAHLCTPPHPPHPFLPLSQLDFKHLLLTKTRSFAALLLVSPRPSPQKGPKNDFYTLTQTPLPCNRENSTMQRKNDKPADMYLKKPQIVPKKPNCTIQNPQIVPKKPKLYQKTLRNVHPPPNVPTPQGFETFLGVFWYLLRLGGGGGGLVHFATFRGFLVFTKTFWPLLPAHNMPM